MPFVLALATGFLIGFFVPTRAMVMLLVPVGVVAVNIGYAMLAHDAVSWLGMLIDLVIAYPTALSINRFMHD